MKRNLILAAALSTPILVACSGGSNNNGDTATPPSTALCPSSMDYNTVWTGAGASGELVKILLDTTKLTWQITYLQSVVPATTGTAEPSRAGTTQSGTLTQETGLPTANLNACTYRLNGASLDPNTPARVFIGEGVMGGTLPGKEVQYGGIAGVGVIPDTTFRFFPFLAFTSLDTSPAAVANSSPFTQLGVGLVLTQNEAVVPINAKVTFKADGSYTKCDTTGQYAGQCRQPGDNWVQDPSGSGAFFSHHYQGQVKPTAAATPQGSAIMLLGKLRGVDVPVVVRLGAVNTSLLNLVVDDEVGISTMGPQQTIAQGAVNGEYISIDDANAQNGKDNQFNYRALLLSGTQATLIDPFNASNAATATGLNVSYAQSTPGVLTTTPQGSTSSTPNGSLVFTGGVVSYLDQSTSPPYYTAGAFVQ